jgi:hypothetical protein
MRVINMKARETEICSQVQNPQATMRLLDVPGQERKAVIHQFISQDSVLANVSLTLKMEYYVKKRGSSATGIMCQI